jgi:FkbM family methyltransferase
VKQVGGMWMPEGEQHLADWLVQANVIVDGKLTYQYHKAAAALKWAKAQRIAVDVGAHVGQWSTHLSAMFTFTYAFEPVALYRDCFRKNVTPTGWDASGERSRDPLTGRRVFLHPEAVGAAPGRLKMLIEPVRTMESRVDTVGDDGDVPLVRLDDVLPADACVDLLKIDCEGFELFVLQGAERLLARARPAVVVEQKPGNAARYGHADTAGVEWLIARGAKLRAELQGDYILSWD